MSSLYRNLMRLNESMKTFQNDNDTNNSKTVDVNHKSELLPIHRENFKSQLNSSLKLTEQCCRNLFDLALIVPSAPWVFYKLILYI
jgi:hypothetical protein